MLSKAWEVYGHAFEKWCGIGYVEEIIEENIFFLLIYVFQQCSISTRQVPGIRLSAGDIRNERQVVPSERMFWSSSDGHHSKW